MQAIPHELSSRNMRGNDHPEGANLRCPVGNQFTRISLCLLALSMLDIFLPNRIDTLNGFIRVRRP